MRRLGTARGTPGSQNGYRLGSTFRLISPVALGRPTSNLTQTPRVPVNTVNLFELVLDETERYRSEKKVDVTSKMNGPTESEWVGTGN